MTLVILSVHCAVEVKYFYREGKVMSRYLPAHATESTQGTGACHSRSIRCSVVRSLEKWLMVEFSMERIKNDFRWKEGFNKPFVNCDKR